MNKINSDKKYHTVPTAISLIFRSTKSVNLWLWRSTYRNLLLFHFKSVRFLPEKPYFKYLHVIYFRLLPENWLFLFEITIGRIKNDHPMSHIAPDMKTWIKVRGHKREELEVFLERAEKYELQLKKEELRNVR